MVKLIFCLFLFYIATVNSICPDDICDAVYNNTDTVIRADDGDLYIPSSGAKCQTLNANCIGENCHACKCKSQQDTWNDRHQSCKNINNCYYMFSRNGLSVNTTVSTVYFAKNANSMYDFRSSEDDNPVSVVLRSNGSDIQINCTISKLEVMTENDWMEVDYEGYGLTVVNKKSYIQMNISQLKIQPEHFQGKLMKMSFNCPQKRCMYFKVQGKSVNLDTCLNCEGNFKYLDHLVIPEFQRPSQNDFPIHPSLNVLQLNGNDVEGCNEDQVSYYPDTCSLTPIPGDNLIYATQNRIQGRNLNAEHWDMINSKVMNITINCSNNLKFCILFQLTDSSTGVCSDNPCRNGGNWTQKGISSCVCQCPLGYTGDDCSFANCFANPCCNGATCSIMNTETFTCFCPPGKTGLTCCDDIDYCTDDPCCDGATCSSNYDLLLYECFCPPGKTGLTCCDDIDYCENNPCCNGGTCEVAGNSFKCFCPAGYIGDDCCDINECGFEQCQNGGTCEQIEGVFECVCPDGYTGDFCELDIDECDQSTCKNGGSCQNMRGSFICRCANGYSGDTCTDIDCDQKSCQNGGTCRNGQECTCLVGFEGDFCENRTTTPTVSTSDRPVVEDDITPEEAAIDQNDSEFPVLPVVYAVGGILFVTVVGAVLAGVLYKKLYLPWKLKKKAFVVPFSGAISQEVQHYNPMYLDTYASLNLDNQTKITEVLKKPLVDVDLCGFDNPLYNKVDPVYEELPETPYDTLQKPQSDGVYEEPMIPNIYDTLELSEVH